MEPQAAFDPVSQRAVTVGSAPASTVYQGRAYYFESRENRDTFEGNPEKYLARSPAASQPIESADRPRRRRGC